MSKVSVIIPTYNCAKFLPEAIKSALNQTFQDFEIIIVDDGSIDNTQNIVNNFIKQHPDKIHYFYQENTGLAIARNNAIKNSKGQFIALLDADDVWLPSRLEEGIRIIESSPSVGLVHANITRISDNGTLLDTPSRKNKFLSGYIFEHLFLRKAHISCPTVLFRKLCCDMVGNFDPNLTRLGCEDRDLWLRIARKYKIVYFDKVLSYYRVTSQSMSRNIEKMTKARLYVIDKYCPQGGIENNLRNKALSKVFHDLGDEFLLKNKFKEAQYEYFRAIKYNPFIFWTWVNFLKASLRNLI